MKNIFLAFQKSKIFSPVTFATLIYNDRHQNKHKVLQENVIKLIWALENLVTPSDNKAIMLNYGAVFWSSIANPELYTSKVFNNHPYIRDWFDFPSTLLLGRSSKSQVTLFNPLPPKISLVILPTVCQMIFIMLVWRIWYWIN